MKGVKLMVGLAVLLVAGLAVMPCEAQQVVVRQPFFRPNAVVVRNAQPQRLVAPQRIAVAHRQPIVLQHFVQPQSLVVQQPQQFFLQQPQSIVVPGNGCNGNCNGGSQLLLRR